MPLEVQQDVAMKILLILLSGLLALPVHGEELQEVAFSSSGQLCSISPDGAKRACVVSGKEFSSPAWQPKGKYIVAEAGEHDAEKTLELLDSKGKRIRTLSGSTGFVRPVWTPDGRYIYAVSYSIGTAIGRWQSDGTHFERIPVTGAGDSRFFQMLSFSPSGKRVAILNGAFNGLYIARVTRGGPGNSDSRISDSPIKLAACG